MIPSAPQSPVTASTFEHRSVAIRPLALPSEHGGWGLVIEPIVLALLVSPSLAGGLIAVGALASFLTRHPLKLAAHDWLAHRRYPRTAVSEILAGTYAMTAFVAFALAWRIGGPAPLFVLAAAIPFAAIQFSLDVARRGRTLTAELCGAALPAAFAAAIAGPRLMLPIAMLVLGRSIPAVLYVRTALRGRSRTMMLIAHAAAVIGAFAVAPPLAGVAMTLLLIRALVPVHVPARTVGLRELAWGAVTVALIAVAYLS